MAVALLRKPRAIVRRSERWLVDETMVGLFTAYATFVARLLGEPYLAKPLVEMDPTGVGKDLGERAWRSRDAAPEQDLRDKVAWAQALGIADWFEWQLMGDAVA
jgi:hypothetical protein